MRTNFFKKKLPNKLYVYLVTIYSKVVPFWIVKLLPNRTAPANKRFNFIRDLALNKEIKTFVETGTYLGDTTAALSGFFNKIYTFEISKELVELAKIRFENDKHIEIIEGDSGEGLGEVLSKINEKTIFWLDGHYSEGFLYSKRYNLDTPVIKEIETIFKSNIGTLNNIILIDDAFEFDGTRGYPTIEELKLLVNTFVDNYDVYVKYNIVFVTPRNI